MSHHHNPKKGIVCRKNEAGLLDIGIHEETFLPYLASLQKDRKGWVNFIAMPNNNPEHPGFTVFPYGSPALSSHKNMETK